ncbi:MFS transporter [Paenibacillus sp. CMAA1364]
MVANRWSILHVVNLGTFMLCLDVGIANVALPVMAQQFSVSLDQIQWVVTSYLLILVALLPIVGKLSDRFDRRQIYSFRRCSLGIFRLAYDESN